MQLILHQVGIFLVGSIPTALLFIVLVFAYQFLVQGPLTATLKRRRALTEGAIEDAQKAIELAEARAAEYAEKLRQARADALKLRDQRLKQWNTERDAALDSARAAASHQVAQARSEIETQASAAKLTIQSSAHELADQVVQAVLPAAAGGSR